MSKFINFNYMRNGYNTYEVDDVVNKLQTELEEAKTQVENYRLMSEHANQQLELVKERYQKLTSQIEVREKAADEISRLSLKEANRLISNAQDNADNIVLEAITTARLLLTELNRLAKEASQAKEDMQCKLNELQGLLDNFEIPNTIDEKWLKD